MTECPLDPFSPPTPRQAIELCLSGQGAEGVLEDATPHIESALAQLGTPGQPRWLPSPAEEALLSQNFQELLTRYDELALAAKWLGMRPPAMRPPAPLAEILSDFS